MRCRPHVAALFVVLFAVGAFALPVQAQDSPASSQEEIQSPDATIYVDGLACPFCAYGLEKKLDDLDAIEAMEVQVEESRILVAFREGERATEDELHQAVEDAGFSARKIEFPNEEPSGRTH